MSAGFETLLAFIRPATACLEHFQTYVVFTTVLKLYEDISFSTRKKSSSSSSSSSSYIFHAVGPLVDPFRSHITRSLFKGLP